jgi:uncharacterized YigZ family protein
MKTLKTVYDTIERTANTVFTDRGSRFIAYAAPVESVDAFRQFLAGIKKEHPKAVHHCFAYRLGTDGNLFRSSDDGEPSGTAGKPMLGQIDSKGLTNTAVIVVRYFGGTLLGIPGLIHAYKTSASLVLQLVPVVRRNVGRRYALQFDYTAIDEVLGILRAYNCSISQKEIQLFCSVIADIPLRQEPEILEKLGRISGFTAAIV